MSNTDTLPWTVRYTWRPARHDVQHPGQTFTRHATETDAIDAAVRTADSQDLRADAVLVATHRRREGAELWIRIE